MKTFLIIALTACGAVVLGVDAHGQVSRAEHFAKQRAQMVEEYIACEGVENERVLDSMRTVPRHEFVPAALQRRAYFDGALPIGHRQTISPPFIVAYMTETIDPQPGDRVLEIGTGSGYQAAVLSGLVQEVYTIEIVEQLGKSAARRLERLGYDNVHAKIGDGFQGWEEHAPFDKIVVTCSPEDVPRPLVEQLAEGGKLLIPLGRRYQQVFHLFEKRDGRLVGTKLIPTLFVPMTGTAEDERDVRPDPAKPRIVNGGFETDANDDGRVDGWHYQRQVSVETGSAPEGERHVRLANDELGRPAQLLQGTALDGRQVAAIRVSMRLRYDDLRPGLQPHEQPAFVVHFYDAVRRPIGNGVLGPFVGTSDWTRASRTIRVPGKAREAILRVGLNGATGTLDVDALELAPESRR